MFEIILTRKPIGSLGYTRPKRLGDIPAARTLEEYTSYELSIFALSDAIYSRDNFSVPPLPFF